MRKQQSVAHLAGEVESVRTTCRPHSFKEQAKVSRLLPGLAQVWSYFYRDSSTCIIFLVKDWKIPHFDACSQIKASAMTWQDSLLMYGFLVDFR